MNHTTAPVALRERVYLDASAVAPVLARLGACPEIDEVVILSTCNRTEMYTYGEAEEAVVECLTSLSETSVQQLHPHLYREHGCAAVRRLFRVACGLDSLIVGETQILGQVRHALDTALAHGTAGRQLTALFQQAIATGRRARAETAISTGGFSVGHAAVEMARTLFPRLSDCTVLVLGAGSVAELAARHLQGCGVERVLVANRTFTHAAELADSLGGCAIPMQELACHLPQVDILISSTSAPRFVLDAAAITRTLPDRHGRPFCLIDIAVPRDIDPAAGNLPGVRLLNLDDLQGMTSQEHNRRLADIPLVEAIIAQEVEAWRIRQAGWEAAPLIDALRESFEQVRRSEFDRAASLLATLTPEQHDAVEALTVSIVNTLLHTPIIRLKETLAKERAYPSPDMLCDLFAVEMDLTKDCS